MNRLRLRSVALLIRMDRLNFELQDVLERIQRRTRLVARLQRAQEERASRIEVRAALAQLLEVEQADVERLEGLSLTAIFYTLLGSKEQQLEKGRQELLQTKLKYDECQAAIARLEEGTDLMLAQLAAMGELDTEYAELIARKETVLIGRADSRAEALVAFANDIALRRSELREIREACDSGELAFETLDELVSRLRAAVGWGNWDMLGGGVIATHLKYSQIDQARELAHEAQGDLFEFSSQLEDIDILDDELHIEIGTFQKFADFLLDGLLFDWIAQAKITGSFEAAVKAQRRVHGILEYLTRQRAVLEERLRELERGRAAMIEGA